MKYLILLIIPMALFFSCSSPEVTVKRHNDVVRIKENKKDKYKLVQRNNEKLPQNAYYLEGTVLKVLKQTRWAECHQTAQTKLVDSTFVLFIHRDAAIQDIQNIPIEDVVPIGQLVHNIPRNQYDNINIFETSNNPFLPDAIREVPVDSIFKDCPPPETPCQCNDLHYDLDFRLKLKCPECKPDWWFFEPNYFASSFLDFDYNNLEFNYRTEKTFEIAAGLRFDRTQFGFLFNYGIPVSNYFDDDRTIKPLIALYGKHKFNPIFCVNPYIYGLIGTAVDNQTLEYLRTKSFNPVPEFDCIANFGFPLSIGLGAGIDIPIPICWFNLTFDVGYRSLAVGQERVFSDDSKQLFIRRLDLWNFRIGLSFGNK